MLAVYQGHNANSLHDNVKSADLMRLNLQIAAHIACHSRINTYM